MEDMKEGMNDKHGCGCGCCGMGGWGGGHHHHHGPWRILIRILILVIVFWIGVQFGELKVYRGAYMMDGYGQNYGQEYGNAQYGPGMMYRVISGQSTTTAQ